MAVCLAFSRAPLTSPNRCDNPKGVQASTASAIRRSYWTAAFASRRATGPASEQDPLPGPSSLVLLMQRMELIDPLELRSAGGGVDLEGH
jgi:hypothetical protein